MVGVAMRRMRSSSNEKVMQLIAAGFPARAAQELLLFLEPAAPLTA